MINAGGRLIGIDKPLIMGIVNVTPDSFYEGSRVDATLLLRFVGKMLADGADIIDIGGCSTRPGSEPPSASEEVARLIPAVKAVRKAFPEIVISVDTFRAEIARMAVEEGADIINDISGGDEDMYETVADLGVPYVLTHNERTQTAGARNEDIAAEVLKFLAFNTDALHQKGVCDVIIDPGFGFAKTVDENYRLLASLGALRATGCPILVGVSRKRMVWQELGLTPEEALNGTTALHMTALLNGADILRVHDVREAAECVRIYEAYRRNEPRRHTITVQEHGGKITNEKI